MKNQFELLSAFSSPMWFGCFEEYLDSVNNLSDKILTKDAEFGHSTHSDNIYNDESISTFVNFCKEKSVDFLNMSGFQLNDYNILFESMWVQQFSSKGGGNHFSHVHADSHVSGFYFLKCSDKTSYPIWHDPRPGALMTKLPLKNEENFSFANDKIFSKPKSGAMVIFPSYLPHHFTVDSGKEPFRFLHWNLRCQKK